MTPPDKAEYDRNEQIADMDLIGMMTKPDNEETDEEMADKWVKHNCCECCVNKDDCDSDNIYCFAKLAYIAAAEPREKRIAGLEKENADLKAFINAPHTKGRKTTRADYIKTVWNLSKKLSEAKSLINRLSEYIVLSEDYWKKEDVEKQKEILREAEQFLKE